MASSPSSGTSASAAVVVAWICLATTRPTPDSAASTTYTQSSPNWEDRLASLAIPYRSVEAAKSTESCAASAAISRAGPAAGGWTCPSAKTATGPIANQLFPGVSSSLLGGASPKSTSRSRASASAATTASGTTATGIENSSGTNASWVGTV